MDPSTPVKGHSRRLSSFSSPGTPATGYVLAQEDTPTRGEPDSSTFTKLDLTHPPSPTPPSHRLASRQESSRSSLDAEIDQLIADTPEANEESDSRDARGADGAGPSRSRSTSGDSTVTGGSTASSYNSDSLLEMLDDEEEGVQSGDFELDEDDEGDEGLGANDVEPLVGRGRRRRGRRRRWRGEEDDNKERSLFELVPPLLLAHPLPLLPLLAALPYNFLPAGVLFFIPIICVLTALSACAHIVIVYLAWYLKVSSFEEVFASVTGKYGKYGRWAGRTAVIASTVGLLVGWFEALHPLLSPLVDSYLPSNGFFRSGILWTVLPATALLPSLVPSRMTRSLRRSPIFLALLLPVVTFLIIGRTVEIKKATEEGLPPIGEDEVAVVKQLVKRKFGLGEHSSAGAGITTLAIFLSPHINTLPIHSTLSRNKRSSFPLPVLLSSGILLALSLPFALVPYYLLPSLGDSTPLATPTTSSGVFSRLPKDDGWVNLARVLQCAVGLGSCNMWILRGRDSILGGMGVEGGERYKAGRWVGLGLWVLVVLLSCIGGWVAEKIEVLGVIATLAVGWLLPSVFFIITFHVRSPLSIIFPSNSQIPDTAEPTRAPSRTRSSHSRSDSLADPSTDILLARKERQLQKRRLGRRLWQDLIVYVGILPVGCITVFWSLGNLIGIW